MTATVNNCVYVVGKQKVNIEKQPKTDAKQIAEAIERIAMYKKK